MADTLQNLTEWIATPKQLAVLQAAKEPGLKKSISSICTKAGVSRVSFYDWMRNDPGFRAAWARLSAEAVTLHMPTVMAALVIKARKGSVGAARLLAEIEGLVRKRLEVTGRDGGPVRTLDLAHLTPEQLDVMIVLDPGLAEQIGIRRQEVARELPAASTAPAGDAPPPKPGESDG